MAAEVGAAYVRATWNSFEASRVLAAFRFQGYTLLPQTLNQQPFAGR